MRTFDDRHSAGLASYFARIARCPVLPREQEEGLARRARSGDARAAQQLVSANLGIVVRVAKRYRGLGVPFEDLLAEGNVGLVEAVQRFDPTRGTKFISYAIWWIRRAMLKALDEQSMIVRVSYHQKKRLREIRRVENRLAHELSRKPAFDELAADLAQAPRALDRVLSRSVQRIDLDGGKGGEPGAESLVERLACAEHASVEEELVRSEVEGLLASALAGLTDKERQVIEERFGLDGAPVATLQEIGRKMQLSRERVRQIEAEARGRLRKFFEQRWSTRPGRRACWRRPAARSSSIGSAVSDAS